MSVRDRLVDVLRYGTVHAARVDGPQVACERIARAELARALADHHDTNGAGPHLTGCDDILAASEDRSGQEGTVELARAALAAAGKRHHDADEAHARAAHVLATYRLPWKQAEALDAWAAWLTSGAAGAEDA